MQPHSFKLSTESDLIKSIKEYSLANNLCGYVSGVVGNLKIVCIQCRNQEINKFEGNLEIISSLMEILIKGMFIFICVSQMKDVLSLEGTLRRDAL